MWLDEVETFRARMFYDKGRRPCFRADDGQFVDPDPADLQAYHVIASSDDGLVGCFRVMPLQDGTSGLCERLLGTAGLEDVLARLGVDRAKASEGGGWVVDPSYRRQGLGVRILATGVAVAERLGLKIMLGAVGVRYGQYCLAARLGWRPVPGIDPLPAPEFADEVCLVFAATQATTPRFRALVSEAGVEMGLRLA